MINARRAEYMRRWRERNRTKHRDYTRKYMAECRKTHARKDYPYNKKTNIV